MAKKFYNSHAHCFTYDHVPEYFLSRWVPISYLLKRKWLKTLIQNTVVTGQMGIGLRILLLFLKPLFGFNKLMLTRYLNFVKYGDRQSQEEVIKSMQAYYPASTGLVMLTMDMEYMGAGEPKIRFEKQLTELAGVKQMPSWSDKVYPFVFCDPRRLLPQHPREIPVEATFIKEVFYERLESYLKAGIYQGIKIYPALGYFPFDKRMKAVYDLALANNFPVLTHCTIGAVHFKYELDVAEREHPFLNTVLPACKPSVFQQYYTHPLNFECLLNVKILQQYWGADAPDYGALKICLAHWGNDDDWHSYLENAWQDTYFRKKNSDWPSLELDNWVTNEDATYKNFSWFTIICDLMRKYPNVYTDISYTLNDATLLPLLKMTLETDEKIRSRVLFGTDFYLVSKASSEREFAINVRAALGNDLFEQIAITNAQRFLNI